MIIRLATPEDASQLKMLNDIFNGQNCNTVEGIERSLQTNTQEIVCVAQENDALIGFCCGQLFISMCYDTNYGEISELFVLEEYRRQGVGDTLMIYMEAAFSKMGAKSYQLFTGANNHSAQSLYRTRGYKQSSELMFRKRT